MSRSRNYIGGGLVGLPPTLSVIVSTYNRPEFLDKALASICAQTYTDFDVWVVDDCTPHGVNEGVLEAWYKAHEARGIPFYAARLGFNSGYQCVPKNAGIAHSKGDFIAYLDDDNTWTPMHLEKMMAAFTPDVDMVYCGIDYANETANAALPTGKREAPDWDPKALLLSNYIDTSAMIHTRGSAMMLSQEAYNVWDESLRRFADWNLVVRFAKAGFRAAPVKGHFINYLWHGENLQLTRKPAGVYAKNLADMVAVQ